jgi:ArsR family transcriptional regulator
MVAPESLTDARWQLYRLLSDPTRLRVLALAAEEELSVSELAELLEEPQPNVSRHATPLRQAGLLSDRRHGTRTLVRLADGAAEDAVVADGIATGRKLCRADGSLERIAEVVARRDARTREFFAQPGGGEVGISAELPAYLSALGVLLEQNELAVDAGTGDGVLLDLLAPLFRRVIAVDRSQARLARAHERVRARGFDNVELVEEQIGAEALREKLGPGADLVVASRILHHAPRPRLVVKQLADMLRPSGRLIVIDYGRHEDEALREQQADVWMGFGPDELASHAKSAGLVAVRVAPVPATLARSGFDAHIPWLSLTAVRPPRPANNHPSGARRGPRPV